MPSIPEPDLKSKHQDSSIPNLSDTNDQVLRKSRHKTGGSGFQAMDYNTQIYAPCFIDGLIVAPVTIDSETKVLGELRFFFTKIDKQKIRRLRELKNGISDKNIKKRYPEMGVQVPYLLRSLLS